MLPFSSDVAIAQCEQALGRRVLAAPPWIRQWVCQIPGRMFRENTRLGCGGTSWFIGIREVGRTDDEAATGDVGGWILTLPDTTTGIGFAYCLTQTQFKRQARYQMTIINVFNQ